MQPPTARQGAPCCVCVEHLVDISLQPIIPDAQRRTPRLHGSCLVRQGLEASAATA